MSQSNTPRTSFVRTEMVGAEPAPASEVGVVGWMRHHLFSSIPNTILTIFAIYLVWVIVPPLLDFALFSAVWSGENREACTTLVQGGVQLDGWAGACWPYIGDYISQFIYGRYPFDQIWRVNLVFFLFVVGLVPILIPSVPYKRENAIYLFGAFPVLAFILPFRRALVILAAVAIAVSGAIGAFHAGVEYGWWEGLTACSLPAAAGAGNDPLAAILDAPLVRCDVAPWKLFGISLAGWNFLFSLASALAIAILLNRKEKALP